MQEALAFKESGQAKTIVFNLSGHGHFDLASYDAYMQGKLVDYEYPTELVAQSLANLLQVG